MQKCEDCIHYEMVKTSSCSFCLCSLAFEMNERRRHNPKVECEFFKDRDCVVFVKEYDFS